MVDLSRRRFLKGAAAVAGSLPFLGAVECLPVSFIEDPKTGPHLPSITLDIFTTRGEGVSELLCSFKDIPLVDVGNGRYQVEKRVSARIEKPGRPSWYRISTSSGSVIKTCKVDSADSSLSCIGRWWLHPDDTLALNISWNFLTV